MRLNKYWNCKTGRVLILPTLEVSYEDFTQTFSIGIAICWLTRWCGIDLIIKKPLTLPEND